MDTGELWRNLKDSLNLSGKSSQINLDEGEIVKCVRFIEKNKLKSFVCELLRERLLRELRLNFIPDFWARFTSHWEDDDDTVGSDLFTKAVVTLNNNVGLHGPTLKFLEALDSRPVCSSYKEHLSAVLLSQIPANFEAAVAGFYSRAFRAFANSQRHGLGYDADESGEVMIQCAGCDQEVDQCRCSMILENCHNINRVLSALGILEGISVGTVNALLLSQIRSHVQDSCVGNFASSQIQILEKWLEDMIFKWLEAIYGAEFAERERERRGYAQFLYRSYTQARIEQLFEIVIAYPESFPSVKDLHECLSRTQLKPELARSLKATFETRLLHQGATTQDILIAYVSVIRAFGVLDPTGVLLEVACEPIKQYLRRRTDTVRHILHSLTDSGGELGGELELGRVGVTVIDDEAAADCDGACIDWESWTPAPSDADPTRLSGNRQSDIVPMLVNIYGSKALFVKEYRKLLSDRLLLNLHFDTEEEIRNLEFLKIRFGEGELHNCEVMLKDVADSKRINAHLASVQEDQPDFGISALVISAQYWDQLKDRPIKLPNAISDELEKFNKNYQKMKGSRSLHWVPQCGSVDLELEFEQRTAPFTVPPDLAAIIYCFEEKDSWNLDELSHKLELGSSHLRRRVQVWQTHGVLVETATDRFEVDRFGPSSTAHKVLLDTLAKFEEDEEDDEEEESSEKKVDDDSGLQMYWSYVVGMLTNLEALSAERIHQMLKMFTLQGSTGAEFTMPQLKQFLDSKVKQQLLIFNSGVYRLPR